MNVVRSGGRSLSSRAGAVSSATGLAPRRSDRQTRGVSIQSLIIDCDPGVDDAVALFLAFAAPELELLAVTTVGGNVPGAKTQRNARIMRQIAGREDVIF